MVLYSADIMDIAEPVKSVKSRKRKQKAEPVPESVPEIVPEVVSEIPEITKKPKSEKQLAAIEKRKASRLAKKQEQTELQKEVEVMKIEPKEVEKVEKVKEVKEVIEPKPKRVRVKKDPTVAPQWFNKYVESVQKEKQQLSEIKVPAKQLKSESQEVARKRWEDGLTRDRVHDEMNNHMSRMYKMIFSGR